MPQQKLFLEHFSSARLTAMNAGSFAEFCGMDCFDDFLLVGHNSSVHLAIAEGRPILR